MLETLWQDLRYALRSLRRAPGFAAAAIAALALGIGANTAIFSLIEAVMLRPLPVERPGELYFVAHRGNQQPSQSSNYRWFERVRQRTDVFAGVTNFSHRRFKVASDAGVEQVNGQYVSGNYHAVVGVPMALGRGFADENDRTAGASPIAVISDAYWARQFGRSPSALGATLVVGGRPVTIVGVTAPSFYGLSPGDTVDITLPLSMRLLDEPEFVTATDSLVSMPIVVRLAPGVTEEAATEAVRASFADFMAEPFNVDFRRTPSGAPRVGTLIPARYGDSDLRDEYGTALMVLMAMVGLVLLIACVNVANLLIVRGAERSRELAVRLSLGARRSRILRQVMIEGLVLAIAGAAAGLLLSTWTTTGVATLLRTGSQPVLLDLRHNLTVFGFTAAVSLLSGVFFSVYPALAATRLDLAPVLKGTSATAFRRGSRGRQVLVAAQVAVCLVLVFAAGLLVRTLQNLRAVDGGFEKPGLVVFTIDARDTPLPSAQVPQVCADTIDRLTARVDVRSGTCSTMRPIDTNMEGRLYTVDGVAPRPDDPRVIYANSVDPAYFDTLGMTIVRGRGFLPGDRANAPLVAVIGETVARHYFGDGDPVGRTIRQGRREPGPPITIVGVVRDARLTLREPPPPMIYTPLAQRNEPPRELLATIRATGAIPAVTAAIRDTLRAVSRDAALIAVRSIDEEVDAALVSERLLALLSAMFAGLALLLACVGVYGVMSYDVARRTRDIGIRVALGATRRTVIGGVLRQAGAIAIFGLVPGAIAAAVASRALAGLLFGLEPRDPATLAGAAAALAATALLAALGPAQRAAHVDPIAALRAE